MHLDSLFEVMPPDFVPLIENLHTSCGTQSKCTCMYMQFKKTLFKHTFQTGGADGCETAFLTIECYLNTNPIISKMVFVTLGD